MTIDTKDLLNSILESLARIDYVKPADLPNIDLYMDQVTTFMDSQMATSKRHTDDKILTKTMINNYAKNNLLPPPVKKKYSKEHVLMLIFIYYFKGILSISDIQEILNPIAEKYFGKEDDFNLEKIYSEVFQLEKTEVSYLQKDIAKKFQISQTTFEMLTGADQEDMQMFAFICMLSFDVYVKKQLIEQIIDARKQELRTQEKTADTGKTPKPKHTKS
ncbi:MAG: DUF1836 domain-containing protein [Lachnospiraceae bacterium]|nr:DUF1836 domain-containing protein [Lachnospiraceae bacterium]